MIILGIDPGLNATGYGILETLRDHLRFIAAGDIRPPKKEPLPQRLGAIHDELLRLMERYRPDTIVLEKIFTHYRHVTTATLMAHARGVACLAAARHQVPLVEYLPTRVKKAVTGYGVASKQQMSKAVGVWLSVETSEWAPDVTDALALAITHAHIHTHAGLPSTGRRLAEVAG